MGGGHDRASPARAGSQHSVIGQLVHPRRRGQGCQALQEGEGIEHELLRPVAEGRAA